MWGISDCCVLIFRLSTVCLLLLNHCCFGGDYSGNTKKVFSPDSESPFRIQKLNFILQKARLRVSSRSELKSLFLDLSKCDLEFLDAKQLRGEGKDPDGEVLRKAEKHLSMILTEHGLTDVLRSLDGMKSDPDGTWTHPKHGNTMERVKGEEFVEDPKLHQLWKKALEAGFEDEALFSLKNELVNHQEKMRSYEKVAERLGRDYHENSVHHHSEEDRLKKKEKLKVGQKQLEEDLRDINERILSGDVLFTNSRVKVLWQAAVSSESFSPAELESLKEELRHFQSRLSKLEFYQSELASSESVLKKAGKDHLMSPEHKEQEQKVKHFAFKVEKLENYLRSRISHSEL